MSETWRWGLFEAVGIETEYMIVDRDTLEVRALADEILKAVGGGYEMEVPLGPIAWSNELALHLIELKTNGPTPDLAGVAARFHEHVRRVNAILEGWNACLLPTGMHPWMDPEADLKLWPHEDNIIYRTLHRIFDCRGHGWANLQSIHVNLPFRDDDEFRRLHRAIRMALPVLPALAASSPFADGRFTGMMDYRVEVYGHNADRFPSVVGRVIPERVGGRADYEGVLLQRIYDELAPLDPEGVLRYEWINARGCIARFDRGAIEIRLLDTQECAAADAAVVGAVTAVVRDLVDRDPAGDNGAFARDELELAMILEACTRDGERAVIRDGAYLRALGYPETGICRAGDLWRHLVETVVSRHPAYAEWREPLETILDHGVLARRLVAAAGEEPDRKRLHAVYGRLAACLQEGTLFPGR
jgi:gamma-glutamyl:cysteine ligase YbdK (ATP-grasp superfamily)